MRGELLPEDSEEDVCASAKSAMGAWLKTRRAVSMPAASGIVQWLGFESDTWELGERLRQTVSQRKAWRTSTAFLDLVAWVLRNDELDKGRQPFVEFAVKWDLERNRQLLGELLSNSGVHGQVIAALRRQRVPGFAEAIRRSVAGESRPWVRKEAKRYLKLEI